MQIHRFCSDEKQNLEVSWEKGESQPIERPVSYKVLPSLLNPEGRAGEKNRTYGTLSFGRFKVFPESHEPWRKRILDPGSDIFLQWNRVFLFSCLVALFVDPLFFYLPTVVGDGNSSCVKTDLNLGIVVTCFRTIADVFYLLHMAIKFRTAYVSPSSRVFGRGELVMDPKEIARRYLKSDFFIDLVATLPLPQVLSWICFQYWPGGDVIRSMILHVYGRDYSFSLYTDHGLDRLLMHKNLLFFFLFFFDLIKYKFPTANWLNKLYIHARFEKLRISSALWFVKKQKPQISQLIGKILVLIF